MMRVMIVAASMALASCAAHIPSPSTVANATVLDEDLGIGAEVAYTTAAKLGTALAKGGVIDREQFKAADARAYRALLALRAAYRAGNATNYLSAAAEVYATVAEIRALVK